MEDMKNKNFRNTMKKRIPLFVFLTICTIAFFLASSLLLDDSYKDIILIAMVWSLPLFIH
jgi:hypothetical protein